MSCNKLPQSRTFGFQIESQDSRSTVITLGKYGLSGGGKPGAYISSAAMTTTGLVMVFFGAAPGAVLVNAGVSGGIYTYRTENYSDKDYAKELGISVLSSGASGGLSWLGSGVALIGSGTKILVSTCSSAVGNCTRVVARHLFSGELPSIKEVGKSAIGGVAGSLASAGVDSFVGAFVDEGSNLLSVVMKKGVTEGR